MDDGSPLPGRGCQLALLGAELFAASAFGVAQPMLSLLGANPTFFVAHHVQGATLVMFALGLLIVFPAILFAVVAAVWLASARAGNLVQRCVLGVLISFAITPPLARAVGARTTIWVTMGVVAAAVAVYGLGRLAPLRAVLRTLAFAPILFLVSFLFMSKASSLVTGSTDDAARALGHHGTPPTVWLVLDQFPMPFIIDDKGAIMGDRFPNLARLASISTWYPNGISGAAHTDLAVPAALSGSWPEWGQLPVASQHPQNLFTILGGDEYPVDAEEYVTQMCPDSLCGSPELTNSIWLDTKAVFVRYLLPERLADRLVPPIDDRWDGFGDAGDRESTADGSGRGEPLVRGEATNEAEVRSIRQRADENSVRFARFLQPLASPHLSGIHYAHLFLPHEPFRYLPDGRTMELPYLIKPDAEGRWPDDEPAMRSRLQNALSQTLYADRVVGELLDTLTEAGTLDDALVVVMTDHGASTRPGVLNRSITDPDSMVDTAPEAIFIKAPRQTSGRVDDRRAQQVDILPTVLSLLGVRADGLGLDGLAMTADHDDEWAERKPMRLTETGLEQFSDAPRAKDSPTIDWLDEMFPDPADPFRMRPLGDLVGTTVDPSSLEQEPYEVALETRSLLGRIDTTGNSLPATVIGTFPDPSTPANLFVAVVLNGRVAGITQSFTLDAHRFSVVVDPTAFVDGINDVVVLVADGTPRSEWRDVDAGEVTWRRVAIR